MADREELRFRIRRAKNRSRSWQEFQSGLGEVGVVLDWRFSKRNPEQVTGTKFSLAKSDDDVALVFGGSKIASDLSFPKLAEIFGENPLRSEVGKEFVPAANVLDRLDHSVSGMVNQIRVGEPNDLVEVSETLLQAAADLSGDPGSALNAYQYPS